MKLNAPEEIMLCHRNEKATNHPFSPLICTVAQKTSFAANIRALLSTLGEGIRTIIDSNCQYYLKVDLT